MGKRFVASALILSFCWQSVAFSGIGSKNTAYHGGTMKDQFFPGAAGPVEGYLDFTDGTKLIFNYKIGKQPKSYSIPWAQFIDIEYGQKAGRRVGAAIATAVLLAPVGLFLLFSKKRKHFVTIGYHGEDGKDQVAIFELGKDIIRTSLPILKTRSGKEITYQDEEAKKAAKG